MWKWDVVKPKRTICARTERADCQLSPECSHWPSWLLTLRKNKRCKHKYLNVPQATWTVWLTVLPQHKLNVTRAAEANMKQSEWIPESTNVAGEKLNFKPQTSLDG